MMRTLLLFASLLALVPMQLDAQDTAARFTRADMRFRSGGVTLAGTLTMPRSAGPHPALVCLSGSGAQTRDGELFGFPLFELLSRRLAALGIAVLSLDDRGTGASTGSYTASTLEDFAADALAAAQFLRGRAEVDPSRIGLVGHSEGGAVAQLAAARGDGIAFVVMLAGPCIAVEANILLQTEQIDRANGMTERAIARELALLRRVLPALRSGAAAETLRPLFRAKAREDVAEMPPAMRRALRDTDAHGDVLFAQQMEMMDTPWFRSLAAYDPGTVLPSINCPMLALFGEKDMQVPALINQEGFARHRSAACGDRAEILPHANHLFQHARSGAPAEYTKLQTEFVDGLPDAIASWITGLGSATR